MYLLLAPHQIFGKFPEPVDRMKYFAYGSNMCAGRLRDRVSSAEPSFVARLCRHRLRFHKVSNDGSGKADAEHTDSADDFVWGVVFEFNANQKAALDDAEGLGRGYEEKVVTVENLTGQQHDAQMYFASQLHKNSDLRPYSWYLRFVLGGARQHTLPSDYVALLEQIESTEDPDRQRDCRNRAIAC